MNAFEFITNSFLGSLLGSWAGVRSPYPSPETWHWPPGLQLLPAPEHAMVHAAAAAVLGLS